MTKSALLRRPVLALLCGAAALTGCRDGGQRPFTTTTTSGRAPSTTTAVSASPAGGTAGGIDPLTGASVSPVSVKSTARSTALHTALRAARHEGFDRVVFEFGNVVPGYSVGYVSRPVTADGSGDEVSVEGTHVVEVRMEPALDADLSQESAPRTYTGPNRLTPSTPQVVEVVRTGGFEAVLTWVIGLRDRVAFRVSTLQQPPRLVLDFANH